MVKHYIEQVEEDGMGEACGMHGKEKKYRDMVGKPEGKRSF